jgi:hypothetical protein
MFCDILDCFGDSENIIFYPPQRPNTRRGSPDGPSQERESVWIPIEDGALCILAMKRKRIPHAIRHT